MRGKAEEPAKKDEDRTGDFVVEAERLKKVGRADLERAQAALAERRRQFSDEVSIDTLRFVVG